MAVESVETCLSNTFKAREMHHVCNRSENTP